MASSSSLPFQGGSPSEPLVIIGPAPAQLQLQLQRGFSNHISAYASVTKTTQAPGGFSTDICWRRRLYFLAPIIFFLIQRNIPSYSLPLMHTP